MFLAPSDPSGPPGGLTSRLTLTRRKRTDRREPKKSTTGQRKARVYCSSNPAKVSLPITCPPSSARCAARRLLALIRPSASCRVVLSPPALSMPPTVSRISPCNPLSGVSKRGRVNMYSQKKPTLLSRNSWNGKVVLLPMMLASPVPAARPNEPSWRSGYARSLKHAIAGIESSRCSASCAGRSPKWSTTTSAPSFRHHCCDSRRDAVAITLRPAARASWNAIEPTPPAPLISSTGDAGVCPVRV